jgi:hypothetical protein
LISQQGVWPEGAFPEDTALGSAKLPVGSQNRRAIERIFKAACTVMPRVFEQGPTLNCPIDAGVIYHVAFQHGHKIIGVFTYDPDGCQGLTFSLKSGQAIAYLVNEIVARRDVEVLQTDIASAAHVDRRALFPFV